MISVQMNVINYLQMEAGFSTSRRVFDYDYLLYVHRGRGCYRIGNVTWQAGMGDMFYCPPGTGNTIISDRQDPFLLSGIEFTAPEFRELLPERVSFLQHSFLTELVLEMVREYRYQETDSRELCSILLSALLKNMARMNLRTVKERDSAELLLEYLSENFRAPVTHQDLSKRFSIHKNTVNRILEQRTGLSLKNYLITLRLRRACELLKYSDFSISEIAELSGYRSDIYFSRQFREKVGITPGKYRQCHGNLWSE